jgi:hypothetical protein
MQPLSLPTHQHLPSPFLNLVPRNRQAIPFIKQDSVNFPFPISNNVPPNLSLEKQLHIYIVHFVKKNVQPH